MAKEIADLAIELEQAKTRAMEARRLYDEASREQTTAITGLNLVQRAIDEWYVKQGKEAPRESDWGRKKS